MERPEKKFFDERHPAFERNRKTWELVEAAADGAAALLALPGVLERHERESEENYRRRKAEAYGFEYSKSVVGLFDSYLHQKEPVRDLKALEKHELFRLFEDDADLEGTNWTHFLRARGKDASIFGHCGFLVDKPAVTVATRAEEKALGLYPYVVPYTPLHILNWTYKRKESGRPYLAEIVLQEGDGLFKVWRDDGEGLVEWALYRVDKDVEVVREGAAPQLNAIPWVWVYNEKSRIRGVGRSDISGVALIEKSVIRNLSQGEEIVDYAAFPMLRKPFKRMGDEGEDVAGPTAILEFDPDKPDAKPDWLPAEVLDPIDAILQWMDKKVHEMFRTVNVGALAVQEKTVQPRSGVALRIEFQQMNAHLAAKAANLQEAELSALWFWLAWQGETAKYETLTVNWPDEFDVQDLAEDLANALTAKTVVQSKRFSQALQKRLARTMLPSLAKRDLVEIDREIEAGRAVQDPEPGAGE